MKISKTRLPEKKSINLIKKEKKRINPVIAVPSVILIVLLSALFSKVFVADRIKEMNDAVRYTDSLEKQVEAGLEKLNAIGDIDEEFSHFTYEGFTDDEINICKKSIILGIIGEVMQSDCEVTSLTVKNNSAVVMMSGVNLLEINRIAGTLDGNEHIRYCTISNAVTEDTNHIVTAQIEIIFI